jgi:hypothetical protein
MRLNAAADSHIARVVFLSQQPEALAIQPVSAEEAAELFNPAAAGSCWNEHRESLKKFPV